MSAQLLALWVILTLIPTVITLALLASEFRKNRKLHQRVDELQAKEGQSLKPDLAQYQAQQLIHGAAKKADTIMAEAEIEGIKIAAQTRMSASLFEEEIEKKLVEYLKLAQQKHEQFLQELEQQGIKSQQQIEDNMSARINEVLLKFEQNLSQFLASSQQKSMEALELELKSARQLIDGYKTQQLKIIDENIVAVLERTLSLVLKNKLSLKDQLDLIFEGLERAKVEKFFA